MILKLYFDRKRFRGLDVEDLMEALNIDAGSKEHIELIKLLRSLSKKDMIVFFDNKKFRDDINIDENVLNILLENRNKIEEIDFNDLHSVIDYFDKLFERRDNDTVSLNKFFKLIRVVTQKSKDFNFLVKYSDDEIAFFFKVLLEEIQGKIGIYASKIA